MFAGGGLTWFDDAAKRGAYALPLAEPGARPDLSGLSCRWGVAPAKHGLVLSLFVAPRGNDARFATLINEIVKSSLAVASSERPVTLMSLRPGNPGRAVALETLVKKASGLSQAKAHIAALRGAKTRFQEPARHRLHAVERHRCQHCSRGCIARGCSGGQDVCAPIDRAWPGCHAGRGSRLPDPDRVAFETLTHSIRIRVSLELLARRLGGHGRRLL